METATNDEITEQHPGIDRAQWALSNLLEVQSGRSPAQLRTAVLRLEGLLETHFSAEERSSLFTELPIDFPRFANRLDVLRREHGEMLAELRSIYEAIGRDSGLAIRERFVAFSEKLDAHEHAELEILQRAHTQDIAPGD